MTRRIVTVLLGALILLSACSSSPKPKPTASPTTTPAAVAHYSPLTGEELRVTPNNPVFAVKIDNTPKSAPQRGIDQADLVVEELVEGGLTRLAALYYSTLPSTVGHVRSVRATDIGIAQPVAAHLVASGGAGVTLRRLKRAGVPLHTEDGRAPGFSSDPALSRPYNRLVDLRTLARGVHAGSIGSYLQWTHDSEAAVSGPTVTSARVRFSGVHSTGWAYREGAWKRANGTSQKEFAAKNLLVLFAGQADAGYRDPAGNPVPETMFTGSGRAVMFIGHTVVRGRWHKHEDGSTIELSDATGGKVTLPPGRVWIELAPDPQGTVSWN